MASMIDGVCVSSVRGGEDFVTMLHPTRDRKAAVLGPGDSCFGLAQPYWVCRTARRPPPYKHVWNFSYVSGHNVIDVLPKWLHSEHSYPGT